jgi:hypothetical protein
MTTIEYEDIKAGDHLKVTVEYEKGTRVVSEGIAAFSNRYYWVTKDLHDLISEEIPTTAKRTIELVNRPDLPYETGSLIRAILKGRSTHYPAVLARVDQGNIGDEFVWLELAGTGQNFITEEEIVSWVPLKLEPVL